MEGAPEEDTFVAEVNEETSTSTTNMWENDVTEIAKHLDAAPECFMGYEVDFKTGGRCVINDA